MKRFVLCLCLIGCGGSQKTEADYDPLTPEQQQCVAQKQRNNALTSMSESASAKLDANAQQLLLSWTHDLADSQCRNNEQRAALVLHQRSAVSLEMTGTDAPMGFTMTGSRASGEAEVSAIPGLAARADVTQVIVPPSR